MFLENSKTELRELVSVFTAVSSLDSRVLTSFGPISPVSMAYRAKQESYFRCSDALDKCGHFVPHFLLAALGDLPRALIAEDMSFPESIVPKQRMAPKVTLPFAGLRVDGDGIL